MPFKVILQESNKQCDEKKSKLDMTIDTAVTESILPCLLPTTAGSLLFTLGLL